MRRRTVLSLVSVLFLFVLSAVSSSQVWAQATLENPSPGSFQSGVGVISGWVCDAERIDIVFNPGTAMEETWRAGYRTTREDTAYTPEGAVICGDTDNGFGLLFNWNRLGDGQHTISASADGVEFGRATFTVTTLGEEFKENVSGEFVVEDFPTEDKDITLVWQQSLQNFVIQGDMRSSGGMSGTPPRILENPSPGSFQSGVGVISGWVCEAEQIDIVFNPGTATEETWRAGYQTTREDTAYTPEGDVICGDTDNGFGLLFNWNRLGDGPHTISARADGVEFGSATFTVTTLGEEFPRGLSREVVGPDFPQAGTDVVLQWQEAQQNFVITQTTSTPVSAHFIPDTNLRRAVGEALGKPPGATITKTELAILDGLSADGVVDLTGLEFATNLWYLFLSANDIRDLTPLADLAQLTLLFLRANDIRDLTPLAGLTQLTQLDLSANDIRDLTPLAGLTQLTRLVLSANDIRDLTPLAGLAQLTELVLDQMFATDLTPLFGLTRLAYLFIDLAPVSQEELDTLAEAGVAIYGSPLFPGSVDIHHDNVLVMHLPELPVAGFFDQSPYTRRVYLEFEDAFDYLIFVLNRAESPGFPYGGIYTPVRNDTQGIGRSIFSKRRYGSQKQLLGTVEIPVFSSLYRGFFGQTVLHELMHTWANFVVPGHGAHWSFSSADGQLGGFPLHDLVHLGGDRYKVRSDFGPAGNWGAYSPIELYLAGLIPPDEVPDLWVAEDGKWLRENGKPVFDGGRPIFTATKVRTVTIDNIIAEHGERVPDWTTSQKDFQAAVVLLVDDNHPATPTRIQEMSDIVSEFSHIGDDDVSLYNYYEATGGRGTITTSGLSQFLLPD